MFTFSRSFRRCAPPISPLTNVFTTFLVDDREFELFTPFSMTFTFFPPPFGHFESAARGESPHRPGPPLGTSLCQSTEIPICDRLWQKQAVGLKISFVHFSTELINNNLWLKRWKNYYSIFIGSRDMNFVMLFYSEVRFREKRLQSLLISLKILGSACIFNLKFLGTTKAERPNEAIFSIFPNPRPLQQISGVT